MQGLRHKPPKQHRPWFQSCQGPLLHVIPTIHFLICHSTTYYRLKQKVIFKKTDREFTLGSAKIQFVHTCWKWFNLSN